MTCPAGFDPFGERDARLLAHAEGCPRCGDALRVLGVGARVWKEEAASDDARAVFRERRLARPGGRRPARTAALSALMFIAIGAASAWAFGRLHAALSPSTHATDGRAIAATPPKTTRSSPVESSVPSALPSAALPGRALPSTEVAGRAADESHAKGAPPILTGPPTPLELWKLGVACLDRGDRASAIPYFRRVIDAPQVDASLQRRAMFRWAELLLAAGDTVTPRETLWRLVRGGDPSIGFDAALLLERSLPEDRARIWDTFLASAPEGTLRAQALERRDRTR